MTKTATRKGVVPQGEATPTLPKPATDWEAVEKQYRAGVLTVREIARQAGVSHTAVQKRAKESGWVRDLTAKVREAVATGLVATQVASPAVERRDERQIIEEAAQTVIQLVREHRKEIKSLRAAGEALMTQLADAVGNRDELEALIAEDTKGADGEPSAHQRAETARRNAMLRAVALPAHAGVLKDLAAVMKSVIPLEREAFNIEGPAPAPEAGAAQQQRTADALASIDALGARLRALSSS